MANPEISWFDEDRESCATTEVTIKDGRTRTVYLRIHLDRWNDPRGWVLTVSMQPIGGRRVARGTKRFMKAVAYHNARLVAQQEADDDAAVAARDEK